MKYVFPAVFLKEEDNKYSVYFPDVTGAYTCGDTLEEAMEMAEDCLNGHLLTMLEEKMTIPKSSNINDVVYDKEKEFVSLIKVDLTAYKKKILDTPIRKTVYIPKELNDNAEALGINFSQVLRTALAKELQSIENK